MAWGYRLTQQPFTEGMIVMGELVGVYQDSEGEVFIISAESAEVHAGDTKATEVIGTLEPSGDD
jgi:hypothetical protein